MKRVLIVQARMTSTRLPGKVLMDLAGQPMLAQQLRRLKRCQLADEIVIATTTNSIDDPIITVAEKESVRWFRGNENNVLSRYIGAAKESQADIIVRVTADCPLIDAVQTDLVIEALAEHTHTCDYASNVLHRTFPRGLDTEAFFTDTLERLERLATSSASREHVTYFITTERPDLFARHSVIDTEDNSDLRWTVDTPEDLNMVVRIYNDLGLGDHSLPYSNILKYVRLHSDISFMNSNIKQKSH